MNEALPETSAWLQQTYFAAFHAFKIYEDLVNLLDLFSGKEGKEAKPSPYLAVAILHQETAISPRTVLLKLTAELFLTRTHQRNHSVEN